MAVSQAQVMTTENEAYAKCGPTGATEQDDLYSSQKVFYIILYITLATDHAN